jgi:hypothetical protein
MLTSEATTPRLAMVRRREETNFIVVFCVDLVDQTLVAAKQLLDRGPSSAFPCYRCLV